MLSKTGRVYLLAVVLIACGIQQLFVASRSNLTAKYELRHSHAGEIVGISRKPRTRGGRPERIEFKMKSGESWWYTSGLPRYEYVWDIASKAAAELELDATGDSASRESSENTIRKVYSIHQSGRSIVTYEEIVEVNARFLRLTQLYGILLLSSGVGVWGYQQTPRG